MEAAVAAKIVSRLHVKTWQQADIRMAQALWKDYRRRKAQESRRCH